MKIEKVYVCENCEKVFKSQEECEKHEKKCTQFLPTIFCYYIYKYEIPKYHKNLNYHFYVFVTAKKYDNESILLYDPNDVKEYIFNNYIKNIDIIKNNEVMSDDSKIYVFSFDNSVENREICLKKIINYRLNELIKEKEKIERNIELYKNCNTNIQR